MNIDVPTSEQAMTPASREERLDFLRQSIAVAEHNIRSYDTKAQLSMAAFLLSIAPLWTVANSVCTSFPRRGEAVLLMLSFLAVVLLYCNVLRPVQSLGSALLANVQAQNLFYIKDPAALGSVQYVKMLKNVSIENELVLESLKLAKLRSGKHKRFNFALGVTILFYALFAIIYLSLLNKC